MAGDWRQRILLHQGSCEAGAVLMKPASPDLVLASSAPMKLYIVHTNAAQLHSARYQGWPLNAGRLHNVRIK